MDKDFADFQKHFMHYRELFGLKGYTVYFRHEPLDESFAQISITRETMVATVTFNSELPDKDKPFKDIKRDAKHEALHLLINRLEDMASNRYVTNEAIYEASEELVHKLEELIKE